MMNNMIYGVRGLAGEAKVAVETATPLTVEQVGSNHIYFYSEVNSDRCLSLIQTLRNLESSKLAYQFENRMVNDVELQIDPIWLHVNSDGGSLFDGFAAANQMAQLKIPVYTVVEGLCASAATLISLAGTKRFMQPNSFMLVHEFRAWFFGKHEAFKDEMELQQMTIEQMIAFYVSHTKVKPKVMREMLKHDFWMDADKALELGFIDEILDA